jgi:hypothetical protein
MDTAGQLRDRGANWRKVRAGRPTDAADRTILDTVLRVGCRRADLARVAGAFCGRGPPSAPSDRPQGCWARICIRYAQESSWREDNRRVSNGDQVNRIASLAMKRGKSVDFTGYWQRHVAG